MSLPAPTSWRDYWRLALVTVVAAGLNALPIEFFAGSRLFLGAYVYMPLVLALPRRFAVVIAGVAMAVTLPLVGHPFLLGLAILEAAWLTSGVRRFPRVNPVALDLAYWAIVGLPAGFWVYTHVAVLPRDYTWLLLFKQLANQGTAVAIAHGLVSYTRVLDWVGIRPRSQPQLRTLVSHYVLLLSLVPLSVMGVGLSLVVHQRTSDYDMEVMQQTGEGIAREMDRHIGDHFEDVRAVTVALQHSAVRGGVDDFLSIVRRTHPAFLTLLVADADGNLIGVAPSAKAGLDHGRLSAAAYFRVPADTAEPYVSAVFHDLQLGSGPLVAISVPWLGVNGRVAGVAVGVLGGGRVRELIAGAKRVDGINYVLAGPCGRVIAADEGTGRAPLHNLHFDALAPLLQGAGNSLSYDDSEAGRDRQRYVACLVRSSRYGFIVIGRRPMLASLRSVRAINLVMVAMIVGVALTGTLVTREARRKLSAPLEYFASEAAAQGGSHFVKSIPPPSADLPSEVERVFDTFNQLAVQLEASYSELRRNNAALDRRVAERTAQLEAANASKTRFLAITSHEIRTPISAVIGLAAALIDEARDPNCAGRLRTIHDAAVRLRDVVNELLDLSRIEAGKFELHPQPVDLPRLCQQVIELFRLRAEQQGLQLEYHGVARLPRWVALDGPRLQQVLINLVANGLKFTGEGGVRLIVEPVACSGATVTLRFAVIDTGPGISTDGQARLFQPYVQLGETSSGSGLGLAISRQLVGLFGGTLQVHSQPGHGAEFFFSIQTPVLEAPAGAAAQKSATKSGIVHLRVLAVDDEYANQEVLRAILQQRCTRYEIVDSGADALQRLAEAPFDVALVDLEMPEIDGFALARTVRSWTGLEQSAGCRLVAVSAHQRAEVWLRCAAAGFDDFVEKPIDRELLMRVLRDGATPGPQQRSAGTAPA